MPITMADNLALFEGTCAVEEAEKLLDWLRGADAPRIDLSACEHLHTAVLQTLLAVRPTIMRQAPDTLVASLLLAAGMVLDDHPAGDHPAGDHPAGENPEGTAAVRAPESTTP